MEHIGTTIFYIILLGATYLLCKTGDKKKKKGYIYAAYIFLFIISAIRYDIGNDYSNYVEVFNDIFSRSRIGDNSLISLLKWQGEGDVSTVLMPWIIWQVFGISSFFLVFAIFSFVTVYFLFKAFDKFNIHTLGLFVYILTEMLFFSWDWTRQCAALSLVLYALTFAYDRKFWKYCLCIAVAFLFHKSAIMLLPVYLINYIPDSKWIKRICVPIILVSVLAFWTGVFNEVVEQTSVLFMLIENDYSKYATSDAATLQQFESLNWKIRVTSYALFWVATIITIDRKQKMCIILLTIGAVFFILANGSLVLGRIALYFYATTVFAVPMAFSIKMKPLKKLVLIGMISLMGLFYLYDCMSGKYTRGCVPYQTIFSEDAERMRFR